MLREALSTNQITSIPTEQPGQVSVQCPKTKRKFTSVKEWTAIKILDQPGIWWRCPECGNWHILLDHENEVI